ncbi:hypothetical protein ACFO0N_05010 [Halobium salinum]|uniref:Small CPxCG-related zinc finger protein n=1 Tax=Halobium salinum TaxID=1364940 RepID=A0ABD5P8U8_9EURY|nr:hypothetical protein [Halobium salinum]
MQCTQCGHVSDWIGAESDWNPVGEGSAHSMYQCGQCGHAQHGR